MKKIQSTKLTVFFVMLSTGAFLLTGCDNMFSPGDVTDVNTVIRGMNYFDQPEPIDLGITEGPIEDGDPAHPDRPEDLPGKDTLVYKVTDADEWEDLLLMNPSSPTIWVGSILDGNSITTGEYRPITAERAPMTISISTIKVSASDTINDVAAVVEHPSLGNVRTAFNNLLGTDPDTIVCTPLSTSYSAHSVNSVSQTSMALGLNYSGWGASVSASLDFSTTRKRTQMVAKFMQVCYTVDVDITTGGPDSYFANGVTWNDIRGSIAGDVSPVIVSSVKYGRMGLFRLESDFNETQVRGAIEAGFSSFAGSGSVSVSAEQQDILDSLSINVLLFGGNSETSSTVINGYEGFCTWISSMNEECPFLDAVPLSYTLSYLKDASAARVVLASEYYKRVVVGEDSGINSIKLASIYNYEIAPDFSEDLNLTVSFSKHYAGIGTVGDSIIFTRRYNSSTLGNIDEGTVSTDITIPFNEGYSLSDTFLVIDIIMDFTGGSGYDRTYRNYVPLSWFNTDTFDYTIADFVLHFEGFGEE
ncbi:MAG: thiol-activated cytolysin family protein [Spirochaetales bacterium]|nr:thiol-activated cytolysin family protein [Spirochaetales bacterium]